MLKTLVITLLFCCTPAFAEPMPAANLKEGVENVGLIFEAEYLNYKTYQKASYFNPPTAVFRITNVIKGEYKYPTIDLEYVFNDGSACLEPEDFKFTDSLMPKVGSRFILLVHRSKHKAPDGKAHYYTYRGDFGRLPLSKKEEVVKLLGAN